MTGPVHLRLRGTGVQQHVPGDRVARAGARFEQTLGYARRAEAHVWTVIVQHLISDRLAEQIARDPDGTEPTLDVESIVTVVVGCFRCEQELDSVTVNRRCPGDPEGEGL
jgi:hypothetical protein